MTGFGESRGEVGGMAVEVEVRSVNNRHLKLAARLADPFGSMESEVERLVREHARRGTINLTVRVDRPRTEDDYRLNLDAIRSYFKQLHTVLPGPTEAVTPAMAGLLSLPGVVERRPAGDEGGRECWPGVEALIRRALAAHQESRAEEGRAMAAELLAMGKSIAGHLETVAARGPTIVEGHRDRLLERVNKLVADRGLTLEPKDVVREVALFAERADVAEEITRLRAHLAQYVEVIHEPESAGRKLEFVVQEMGREANTIGSKANDVEVSREVVEIKGSLEKIRELIQNVE